MKRLNLKAMLMAVSTGILLLFLGITVSTYAQQGQNGKEAKNSEQKQQKKSKTIKQTQPAEEKGKNEQKQPAKVQQPADKPSQQGKRVQQSEQRGVWKQHRARNWRSEHRTWKQRGGYKGYRIPQNHYRGYFGRDHGFRIYSRTLVIYGGYPCFQYGGYWFSLIDPWPEYWTDDWYENDDVYIVYYDDGYYLYNRRHPAVGITINVFVD